MKRVWIIISIALASFVVMLIVAPLRGGYVNICGFTGLPMSMLVYFIVYFILSFFILKKYSGPISPWLILIALLIGTSIVDIIIRANPDGYKNSLVSLPDWGARILAILLGTWCYLTRSKIGRIMIVVITSLFALWCSFSGFDLWLHKLNYGNFSGAVSTPLTVPVELHHPDGTVIDINDIDKEFVVLDLWSTNCGVCFRKFPILQEMYNQHKNSDKIAIYAVHCWDSKREDYGTGAKIIAGKGYSFPCLSMDPEGITGKGLAIKVVPQLLIFYRGELVFRGNIEKARKRLINLEGQNK